MRGFQFSIRIFLAGTVFLSACSNVLSPVAGKTTDEALYEDAIKLMDSGQFTASVAKFNSLSAGFGKQSVVLENWAGALAGECGLNFLSYVQALGAADLTGSSFFKFLMNAWTGVSVQPASCVLAEAKLKEIWAVDAATGSQQLFMAILSLVKMGVYLRSSADNDGTGNLGNGTVDAAYGSCDSTADGHHLSDAEVKEIVTGFSLFLQNIVSFTASLSEDMSDVIPAINAVCAAITPNPCATTSVSAVTTSMVNSMRDILNTSDLGVEACAVPSTACCAPAVN